MQKGREGTNYRIRQKIEGTLGKGQTYSKVEGAEAEGESPRGRGSIVLE